MVKDGWFPYRAAKSQRCAVSCRTAGWLAGLLSVPGSSHDFLVGVRVAAQAPAPPGDSVSRTQVRLARLGSPTASAAMLLDGHDRGRQVDSELVGVGECPSRGADVDHGHGHAPSSDESGSAWRLRQLRILVSGHLSREAEHLGV